MPIRYADTGHRRFYEEGLLQAQADGQRTDSYFRSLLYLCGVCHETRSHFPDLFDWSAWVICPEGLNAGWQTGTSRRVTMLAFNL